MTEACLLILNFLTMLMDLASCLFW